MTFDQSGSRLITTEADKTIKIYKEDETAVSYRHCYLLKILVGLLNFFTFCLPNYWLVVVPNIGVYPLFFRVT